MVGRVDGSCVHVHVMLCVQCVHVLMPSKTFFLSPSVIAICPRTFSNRVWRSLLMACRKYIQWCISYIKLNHIDWVWFLIHEVLKITHNDAPQSVGLLWASDQFVAETSTWQHKTLTTDKHPCPRWDSNPQSQETYALDRAATGTGLVKRGTELYLINTPSWLPEICCNWK